MARPTYADLLLTFTPTASTKPTITDCNNIITALIKKAFFLVYKEVGHYAVSDSYVDTEEIYSIVITRASSICNQFSKSMSVGSAPSIMTTDLQFPRIDFTDEEKTQIQTAIPTNIENIPAWDSDQLGG